MHSQITQLKESLDARTDLQKHLFVRGFLVTDATLPDLTIFPFYGNWDVVTFGKYHFATHCLTDKTFYTHNDKTFFILGHAYNPFTMEHEEERILEKIAVSYDEGTYIEAINELTGIFVVGLVEGDSIRFIVDPSGMQSACQGIVDGAFYMSSHPQLVGDICGLAMDDFVKELIQYKWYGRLQGPYLPGDLTPFSALRRVVPNIAYENTDKDIKHNRFWLNKKLNTAKDTISYEKVIKQSAVILENTMSLIAKKWSTPSISLTGGIDSNTTFAAANGHYNSFKAFSYMSCSKEIPDAIAASTIAKQFNVDHTIYEVPRLDDDIEDFAIKKHILLHNSGYIAKRKDNEIRKRLHLKEHSNFDVEVKSWASEVIRGHWYAYYNRKSMPDTSPKLFRNLYKIFITNRSLAHKIDRIFADYLIKYQYETISSSYPSADVHYLEVTLGSWGSLNINEMKYCFNLTIPYNNRTLLDLLFRVPLKDRVADVHHLDLKKLLNKALFDMNIHVVNQEQTKRRAQCLNLLFKLNSTLPF